MLPFIIEALKTAGALVLVAFALVAYLLLAGCETMDGAGFANTGHARRPACVERDARGNEVWRSC